MSVAPAANPQDPTARLVRILHGLCPLCERTEAHEHGTGDMSGNRSAGDWRHDPEGQAARRAAKLARRAARKPRR